MQLKYERFNAYGAQLFLDPLSKYYVKTSDFCDPTPTNALGGVSRRTMHRIGCSKLQADSGAGEYGYHWTIDGARASTRQS